MTAAREGGCHVRPARIRWAVPIPQRRRGAPMLRQRSQQIGTHFAPNVRGADLRNERVD
jgi:hypothetical protein